MRPTRNHLERIRAAARKMAQLLDDQLTLSRLTRMEMKMEDMNLSLLAEDVAQEIRAHEPSRDVELIIQKGLRRRGIRTCCVLFFRTFWRTHGSSQVKSRRPGSNSAH